MRRAPVSGYATEAKALYRRQVWNVFERVPKFKKRLAVLLPSSEGLEIDVALACGWRQEELIVVDDNPAIVANLRRHWPHLHATFGVTLEEAVWRMAKRGLWPTVANFDLTTHCASDMIWRWQRAMSDTGLLHRAVAVAVTVLRGREPGADVIKFLDECGQDGRFTSATIGRAITQTDLGRLSMSVCGLTGPGQVFEPERVGHYLSGSQTMLWTVGALRITNEKWWLRHTEKVLLALQRPGRHNPWEATA